MEKLSENKIELSYEDAISVIEAVDKKDMDALYPLFSIITDKWKTELKKANERNKSVASCNHKWVDKYNECACIKCGLTRHGYEKDPQRMHWKDTWFKIIQF